MFLVSMILKIKRKFLPLLTRFESNVCTLIILIGFLRFYSELKKLRWRWWKYIHFHLLTFTHMCTPSYISKKEIIQFLSLFPTFSWIEIALCKVPKSILITRSEDSLALSWQFFSAWSSWLIPSHLPNMICFFKKSFFSTSSYNNSVF